MTLALAINRTKFHRPVGEFLSLQHAGEVDATIAMDGSEPLCFFAFLDPQTINRMKKLRVPPTCAKLSFENVSNTKLYLSEGYKDFFANELGIKCVNPRLKRFPYAYVMAAMAYWDDLMGTPLDDLKIIYEKSAIPAQHLRPDVLKTLYARLTPDKSENLVAPILPAPYHIL